MRRELGGLKIKREENAPVRLRGDNGREWSIMEVMKEDKKLPQTVVIVIAAELGEERHGKGEHGHHC